MATNCKDNQQTRDGSGQNDRFLPALEPASTPLDDRGLNEILVFTKHYADLVRFCDIEDTVNQSSQNTANNLYTWKEFFYKDIAVVIASIMQYTSRINQLKQVYDDLRKETDEDSTVKNYNELIQSIISHFQRIKRWYGRSIDDHPLKKELEVKIFSVLRPALLQLIAYDKGSSILQPDHGHSWHHKNEKKYEEFREYPWECKYEDPERDATIYVGKNEERIRHAALYLDDIFLAVLKVYKDLTARSEFYMNAALELYPEHQPHMALFIAFVKLFGYAQKELNTIPKRHLEFYYRDVLHLQERAANADSVYLIYELAKEATEYELKTGTSLTGGKDATGKELIYKTTDKLVINKAKVKELRTLFLDRFKNTQHEDKKVYAVADAKTVDGRGTPFKDSESAWPALGFFQPAYENDESARITNVIGTEAILGFAIASPQLFLAEGTRTITVTLNFSNTIPGSSINFFRIYLTGEKNWIECSFVSLTGSSTTTGTIITNSFVFTINISAADDAIVSYDKKIHGEGYEAIYPIIKFQLMDTARYDELKEHLCSASCTIKVDVENVKNLLLENDAAALENSKSFYPFTPTPKKGNTFFIGSKEVFYKSLTDLTLSFDIIEEGVVAATPGMLAPTQHNPAAILNAAILRNRVWNYVQDTATPAVNIPYTFSQAAVATTNPLPIKIVLDSKSGIAVPNDREVNYDKFPSKENALAGYLKIDLKDDIFSGITIINDNTEVKLPTSFIIKNVSLNYSSVQAYEEGVERFFHIYPFGTVQVQGPFVEGDVDDNLIEDNAVNSQSLLPQFKFGIDKTPGKNNTTELATLQTNFFTLNQYSFQVWQQGHLYIGIENLTPPQNLSLLFKIADGTAEDNDTDPPTINWSYLVNNQWHALPAENLISDSTYQLQATGIVLIEFPEDATNNNTIITNGLHWLCLSVDEHSDRIPKIIDIIAQANKATFNDQQNDPEHYRNPLPESSISKLVIKIPEVKVITQPFESFDGKMREEGPIFYARASERLRHKHRAITPWDYEHLVLQHFPWVYKVKCLTHTDYNCLCRHPNTGTPETPVYDESKCCCGQVAPGHVLIIPISNLRNKTAIDILKPRTGRRTLLQIEEYLKKLTSPFVHVHAKNPRFEEIKTAFKVKFHTGTEKGKYLKQLNEDIVKFLTPWAFDATKEVSFGGKVYASEIINFIEEREYVDYISCFRMIHIVEGCCADDSLPDITDCTELQRSLSLNTIPPDSIAGNTALIALFEAEVAAKKALNDALLARFETEIEAASPRSILTSVKQHCIELINEIKTTGNCNCS